MKEKPIIFSSKMVRSILDGRKTQTRRVVKHPESCYTILWRTGQPGLAEPSHSWSPYGDVGERLWVKERALYWTGGAGGTADVVYEDDPELPILLRDKETIAKIQEERGNDGVLGNYQWWSARCMPRWASRITLEITHNRVERVQDISEIDALKEGVSTAEKYAALWDSLNAKRGYSWESNPWVWVIDFNLLTTEKKEAEE